jgi:hypothetical protein
LDADPEAGLTADAQGLDDRGKRWRNDLFGGGCRYSNAAGCFTAGSNDGTLSALRGVRLPYRDLLIVFQAKLLHIYCGKDII